MEEVEEVTDHGRAAGRGQIGRGRLQPRHLLEGRGQQAVLQAAGERVGLLQRFLGGGEGVLNGRQRGAHVDLVAHRAGHGREGAELRGPPDVRTVVDHAQAAQHVPTRPEDGIPRPGADLHRDDRRVVTGAWIRRRVLDDERIPGQADEEATEAVPYGTLPLLHALGRHADTGLPERAVVVDERDEGASAAGHRSGEPRQVLEGLLGTGVQQAGRLHRGESPRIGQRRRQTVGAQPSGEFDILHPAFPCPPTPVSHGRDDGDRTAGRQDI